MADEKWSDTLGTDTDQLNQSFVKTTNTDSTRKQVATYPAGFIKSSGDITCLYKYSYSGEVRTYSHTFQVKVESEFQNTYNHQTVMAIFFKLTVNTTTFKNGPNI